MPKLAESLAFGHTSSPGGLCRKHKSVQTGNTIGSTIGNTIGNSIARLWSYLFILYTKLCISFLKKGLDPNWPQGIYGQLSWLARNKLCMIFSCYDKSVNSGKCDVSLLQLWAFKTQKSGNPCLSLSEWEKQKLVQRKSVQDEIMKFAKRSIMVLC